MLTSQNFGSYVTGVAFHPTKNLVASCSYDKSVKLWNADTGAELWTVRGHSNSVTRVAFKPDNPNILVSCSWDKTIKTWDVTSGLTGGNGYFPVTSGLTDGNVYFPYLMGAGRMQ